MEFNKRKTRITQTEITMKEENDIRGYNENETGYGLSPKEIAKMTEQPEGKTAEAWTEKDSAILMANRALDVPNADPDDDLRTISRQFLRAMERLKASQELNRELLPLAHKAKYFIQCILDYIPNHDNRAEFEEVCDLIKRAEFQLNQQPDNKTTDDSANPESQQ